MGVGDLTPAMKQYVALKAQYPDCILLFRMGDFYEMFFDDAVTAAPVLEIALTSRNKNREDSIPLCGFPYHAVSSYISRLIENGFKVAICEQMEDPKQAKGVVKRDVVRVVTPGLVVNPDNLEAKRNNFLAALCRRGEAFGLAYVDISTGEFRVTALRNEEDLQAEAAKIEWRELILEETLRKGPFLKDLSWLTASCRIDPHPSDYFDVDQARSLLQAYFPADQLARIDLEAHPAVAGAAGAVLRYIGETQKEPLGHLNRIEWYEATHYLVLDDIAKANLELFQSIQGSKKAGTLLHILDETVTAMGGRRLRWWLQYPLTSPLEIGRRQGAVREIRERHLLRGALRTSLAGIYDLERLAARISMGLANGRDLVALKSSLGALPALRTLLEDLAAPLVVELAARMDPMTDLEALIEKAIADDPPITIREGGLIKRGYDPELDALVDIMQDGRRWIAALEERERKRTGINTLKVGFNNVFGYYIEITRTHAAAVPADYVRKQTLVNAERYINEELKQYEHTVLHAEEQRKEREYGLFCQVREAVAREVRRIQTTASRLGDLDTLAALAEVAERNHYVCPVVDDGEAIEIIEGRHPVVERMPLESGFVPNDVLLDLEQNRLLIITGPNMAGKSTYIRQIALIVILAQMGSFVPAARARIGIVDRIFTRIGAADNLAKGQSTFMVEMMEVANILHHATRRSLIILDEVGRGTSTFDGVSIAWAVAEHLHDAPQLGTRTLFATHYHQLTELAVTKEGVKNFNIAVREWGDRIIFLRKIMEGGTSRSYGIQVARIAGVPDEVIGRAKEILGNLEKGELDAGGVPRIARGRGAARKDRNQLPLFAEEGEVLLQELREVDVLNRTPLEALQILSQWHERFGRTA